MLMKKIIALITLLYVSVHSSFIQAMFLQPCPYKGCFAPEQQHQREQIHNKENTNKKTQVLTHIITLAGSNIIKKANENSESKKF